MIPSGVGFRLPIVALACALLLSFAAERARGADCGSSGNTYWSFPAATIETNVTSGQDGIYVAAGSRLSRLSPTTGAESNSRIFAGVTLRRPTCYGVASYHGVLVTGDNGYVYSLHPTTLASSWSRSVQRTEYVNDETSPAPPVVQIRASSNAAFQAARSEDIAIIGTSYPGTTIANRSYGLDLAGGELLWQVRASDGQGPAFATVSGVGSAPSFDPLVIEEEGTAMLIAHSGGYVKRICVPWPHTAGDKAFLFDPPFHARPSMLLGFAPRWNPGAALGVER